MAIQTNPERVTRIISLTGRRPVRVLETDWPIIASATGDSFVGTDTDTPKRQHGKVDQYFLAVRQHADGRSIIYAVLTPAAEKWKQPAAGRSQRGGMLMEAGVDQVSVIREVGCAAFLPDFVINSCISKLPPEDLTT